MQQTGTTTPVSFFLNSFQTNYVSKTNSTLPAPSHTIFLPFSSISYKKYHPTLYHLHTLQQLHSHYRSCFYFLCNVCFFSPAPVFLLLLFRAQIPNISTQIFAFPHQSGLTESFLDLVSIFDTDSSTLWCPFFFPIFTCKVKSGERLGKIYSVSLLPNSKIFKNKNSS